MTRGVKSESYWVSREWATLSFWFQIPMTCWVTTGVAVSNGTEIGIDINCTGGDNTGQSILPSKCPHSSFPWTTV